jgi:DNA polymerase eta
LKGKAFVVVQYEQHGAVPTIGPNEIRVVECSHASIIAVSYEARARGVKRSMNANTAKRVCSECILVQVPTANRKSDMQMYKAAGEEVIGVMSEFSQLCERKSCDEAAIDITEASVKLLREKGLAEIVNLAYNQRETSHLAGVQSGGERVQHAIWGRNDASWSATDSLLLAGSLVLHDIRAKIMSDLEFSCSGGVSTNKVTNRGSTHESRPTRLNCCFGSQILAKVASDYNKPNAQTVVLQSESPNMLNELKVESLPGLGGEKGRVTKEALCVDSVGQ